MGTLTIVERDTDCNEAIDWPLFYMNDFSVLGLLVDSLNKTLDVLEADGYQMDRKTCSAKIYFENNHRFKNIFHTLTQHRISHAMSDLVRCAYQG